MSVVNGVAFGEMSVPIWAWLATIAGLLVLLASDLFISVRKPHKVTMLEAGLWVACYVICAIFFGFLVSILAGNQYAGEFFAGYITEYSLSIDNLFVFLLIVSAFRVPTIYQHRVLLIGILIALTLRCVLIVLGAAAVSAFTWVFYLFGFFLWITAYRIVRSAKESESDTYRENAALRFLRRVVPMSREYRGGQSFVRINGRLVITPMLVVILAIGTTDLLFAFDSIPAVFGLTKEPFLVFTINAFALMGLRQLYFLIGRLLDKLVYLPFGLAAVLAFIGLKLVFEVLNNDWLPFVPGRQSLPVPVFSSGLSLLVIFFVLSATVVASLVKQRRTG